MKSARSLFISKLILVTFIAMGGCDDPARAIYPDGGTGGRTDGGSATGGRGDGAMGGDAGGAAVSTGGASGSSGGGVGGGSASGGSAPVGGGGVLVVTTGGASGAAGGVASRTGGAAGMAPVGSGGALPGTGGMAFGTGGAAATGGRTGSGGTAGSGGTTGSGGAGGVSAACGMPGLIVTSSGVMPKLVDLFVVPEGIIVVQSDQVALYGRDRQLRRSVPFTREVTTAAVDGKVLVVADRAYVNVLTTDLTVGAMVALTESCSWSVMVSGGRFVCGTASDIGHTFYTYNVGATQPAMIGKSAAYTYNGVPMRRVPGTDDFVTVSDSLSPSDFHLYHVGTDNVAKFVNESPYHGAFWASRVYAFDGTPAQHLIQTQGLLLKIYGDGCNTMTNPFTSGCFVKNGVLGTLRAQQNFLAMSDDGAGTVYGVINTGSSSSTYYGLCNGGCAFQRISVASRTILAEKTYTVMGVASVVKIAADTTCSRLVFGHVKQSTSSSFDSDGFQVHTFDL